jgi:type IV pilus assembly protein PilQ
MVTQIVDVNYAKATTLRQTVQALLARDCTGLSTMATGRELGVPMNQQQGGGQNQGNGITGQGCVVRGSVAADSATNKLIITETPSRLPEIVARLQELDIRTPQVAIKAKIILNLTASGHRTPTTSARATSSSSSWCRALSEHARADRHGR